MSVAKLTFALVIALCALLVWLFLLPEADNVRGLAHDRIPAMSQGGDGLERHGGLLTLGWLFGTVQILLFAALIALGGRQGDRLRGLGRPLTVVTGIYLATWTLLMLAYRGFLTDPGWLWLGLPAPTAVMLYGLWPLPVLHVLLYIRGFDRWIMTAQDLEQLERLMERVRRERAALRRGG